MPQRFGSACCALSQALAAACAVAALLVASVPLRVATSATPGATTPVSAMQASAEPSPPAAATPVVPVPEQLALVEGEGSDSEDWEHAVGVRRTSGAVPTRATACAVGEALRVAVPFRQTAFSGRAPPVA